MGTFRNRLFSKEEYVQLFLVVLFPVNVWAIIVFMKRLPAIILLMSTVQLLSVLAYILVFALLESVLIFGFIFLTSLIIPKRSLGSRLVPIGTIVILTASVSAALIHLYDTWDIDAIKFDLWASIWALGGLATAGLLIYWAVRNDRLEGLIKSGVERLSVLAMVYLWADILGALMILFRNLV